MKILIDIPDDEYSLVSHELLINAVRNGTRLPGNVSEWIPTKERLPEKNGDYLCTIKTYDYYTDDDNGNLVGHNLHHTVLICNFADGEFPGTRYYKNYNIVAWMEVP